MVTQLHSGQTVKIAQIKAIQSSTGELSDAYMARRFSRPGYKLAEATYEVSTDEGLLHQYRLLRGTLFINSGVNNPAIASTDAFDSNCDVLVARRGNHCVAGCRISFRDTDATTLLPMEAEGCNLSILFPHLSFSGMRIAEVSRLAVLPDTHKNTVMRELCREVLHHAVAKKAAYMVALVPAEQARGLSQTAEEFGLEWDALGHMPVAENADTEEVRKVLCWLDLTPVYKNIEEKQPVEQVALLSA